LVLALLVGCATTEDLERGYVEYATSPQFKLNRIITLAIVPGVEIVDTADSSLMDLREEISRKAYDFLLRELMKVPTFDIVERRDLDKVMEELELSNSPVALREEAPRLGKLLGAQAVAYFTLLEADRIVYPFGDDEIGWFYRLTGTLKILDVETGRLLYQATATAEGSDLSGTLEKLIRKCVSPLRLRR